MKPFNHEGEFQPLHEGSELRRVAVKSAGISVLGQAASFLVQIASTMLLGRILSPNDYGIVTMVTTVTLLFRSFGQNGFTELIMQREELNESLASNLFWIELAVGALLSVGFAAAAPLLSLFYHDAAVKPVAWAMSLTIGISCLGWIHFALLQRAMRFRTTTIINFAGLVVLVVVSLLLAFAGWHYWALVWGNVAQTVAVAAGAWFSCRWVPKWPRRFMGTMAAFKFAMNVYSHFAFNYMTRNTDNLLVGWRYGAGALGFYKKAYDLFVLAEAQLMFPISAVAISTLSRVSRDRSQFRRYFLRTVSILAFLGMGIGADLALIGKDVIRVLLGPGWEEAGRIFVLFGPGIGVMMLYNTHGWVHLSIGRPERWLRWGLIEFGVTAGLFLLGLHWGPSGIAAAWTFSFFVLMLPGFWYAGRPIGLGVGPVIAVVGRFFVASVVAGIGTFLVLRFIPFAVTISGIAGALARMVSVSFMFTGLYLCSVVLFHGGLRPLREAVSLFRELLPERFAWRLPLMRVEANELAAADVVER